MNDMMKLYIKAFYVYIMLSSVILIPVVSRKKGILFSVRRSLPVVFEGETLKVEFYTQKTINKIQTRSFLDFLDDFVQRSRVRADIYAGYH